MDAAIHSMTAEHDKDDVAVFISGFDAESLADTYIRFALTRGFYVGIIHDHPIVLGIRGEYAYGHMLQEAGRHLFEGGLAEVQLLPLPRWRELRIIENAGRSMTEILTDSTDIIDTFSGRRDGTQTERVARSYARDSAFSGNVSIPLSDFYAGKLMPFVLSFRGL